MLGHVDLSLLRKQPESSWGRCLRQKFHNKNSCQDVRTLAQGRENRCFQLEFACNFNPSQNIIRLFFVFFSAAGKGIRMYSHLAFPLMTPCLPFSQHGLAPYSENKKEGWGKSCNPPLKKSYKRKEIILLIILPTILVNWGTCLFIQVFPISESIYFLVIKTF